MSNHDGKSLPRQGEYIGVYEDGVVKLSARVQWPDGTRVAIRVAEVAGEQPELGKVIIAGFGLAGRWVADIFDRHGIDYTVVDSNPDTIQRQLKIGRHAIAGRIELEETLLAAGVAEASILALTIPDEGAVLAATQVAKRLNPHIYIVARTNYCSSGMRAAQFGADEVIKTEQVVARQFYEMLLRKVGNSSAVPAGSEAAG